MCQQPGFLAFDLNIPIVNNIYPEINVALPGSTLAGCDADSGNMICS